MPALCRPSEEPSVRERLLKTWYDPHHAKLNGAVERLCTTGRRTCVLIDAHSYPVDPLPTELTTPSSRPEICIGTDKQWSRGIEGIVLAHFDEAGYEVALDTPYSGSLVPTVVQSKAHGDTYAGFSTVMIEVRRDVYLDADTSSPGARFAHLQSILNALYERLLEMNLLA